jgi:tetratricopeptide (TPR) repeat protein
MVSSAAMAQALPEGGPRFDYRETTGIEACRRRPGCTHMRSTGRTRWFLALAFIGMTACATTHRRMDDIDVGAKTTAPAKDASRDAAAITDFSFSANKPLPPATMSNRQLRMELWSIAARRQRGEIGLTISDYAARLANARTLENRFLAAAAIADDDEAWKAFHAIIMDYAKYYWAHAGMAMIYARWKVRDQCEKETNLMLDLAPDITFTYTIRGDLYRNIGENQLALRDYSTALRADPSDADARVGLALTHRALGDTSTFRSELERALQDVPTQYEAALNLALLLDDANDQAAALAAWDRVAHLAPKNRTAQLALARLRGDADPAGAIAAYEKASRQSPLTKVEQAALTKLYHQQGRTDDEIKSLEALAKLDTKDPTPYRRIAEVAEAKHDMAAAEAAYTSILKMVDRDGDALLGLGHVAEKRAQLRQAIDYYRQAKAAGAVAAAKELSRLSSDCLIPERPLSAGNLNGLYFALAQSLDKIYEKRLAEAPRLKGQMKVKIETDGAGKLLDASVTENTLNDPWMEAHLYYAVLDANLPHLKATDAKRFSLTFDLPPVRK